VCNDCFFTNISYVGFQEYSSGGLVICFDNIDFKIGVFLRFEKCNFENLTITASLGGVFCCVLYNE
jgi:hypothetical protein